MHSSDQSILEIVEAGVRGFVLKSDPERDLNIAVEALANHKPFFTTQVTEVILGNLSAGGSVKKVPESIRERITSRERDVLQLVAEGKSSREVASSLGISITMAGSHRTNVMRKLDLHSVTELVRYALRNQIVQA
jgi:DNA-binding NarL/FixJ family response regulator